MSTRRLRSAVLAAVVLVTGLPLAAGAFAPHLTCGPKQTGRWETIPVRPFQPVSGMSSSDTVTAYGLDPRAPQDVVVTNGVRVQVSDSHGCEWRNGIALDPVATGSPPFPGATSTIVSVGTAAGVVMAAVQEINGSIGKPHVLRDSGGAVVTVDNGLPPQGSPRLLRMAFDGRTAYLTISPNGTGGSDSLSPTPLPTVPPLPVPPVPDLGLGGSDGSTALLYATDDAGLNWELRTDPSALPANGQGFTDLVVDPEHADWLYGIAGGKLLVSKDGGASFLEAPGSGYTAVTPYYGMALAFTADGRAVLTFNGRDVIPFTVPKGITSAASRAGDGSVLVEIDGRLRLVDLLRRTDEASPAPGRARPGSLLGDTSAQASFHALSGHDLLRYVDPAPPQAPRYPPIAAGDRRVPRPIPGRVSPAEREVTLPVGTTGSADFTLNLPKNPTPLDLFFLVDVSASMTGYIDDLKANIHKVVDRLERARIDLKVGVGTLGTGPARDESPYPETYVGANGQTYRKPHIYERVRAVGDTSAQLRTAINSLRIESQPPRAPGDRGYHEGQLLALEQLVTGTGVQTQQEDEANLSSYSAVEPGQDAGFRENPNVRRIVVIASDEAFDAPYGTPEAPGSTPEQPILDFRRTLGILNAARVGVFGITAGSPESLPDMTTLARGTRTYAPPGGVSCGGDPEQVLDGGSPLVCSQDGDFSEIIAQVLASLTDRQDLALRAVTPSPVLTELTGQGLRAVDVKQDNTVRFRAGLTCVDLAPGTYAFDVDVVLRDYPVGTARVRVNCVEPQAAVPPLPLPPVVRPPVAPAVQPPPPPPAPPPAAQPQPQPQPNVNPLTAAATQQEEQAQLALALNQAGEPEDDEQGAEQLAMVDRRQQQEVQAFGSLLVAMTACAGLGLARLRGRHQHATGRSR